MRITKTFKPSFHKANARYRGVTEHSQYTNFVLESAHDLLLLSGITTGNEATNLPGHEQEIIENFVSVMTGDEGTAKTNLFTASTLQKMDRTRQVAIPATLQNWSRLNDCQVMQTGDTFALSSQGIEDPVGLYASLHVDAGEIVYIRLKVKSGSGAPSFSFGSNNIRLSPTQRGSVKEVPLEAGSDFVTLDFTLRPRYTETISLNINIHRNPNQLVPANIEVKEVEVLYMEELPIQAASLDTMIKPGLDRITEQMNSIR